MRIMIAAATLGLCLLAGGARAADDLAREFAAPPTTARPQAYWWWLRTPTTKECITRDLEEMKAKGLSGCLLFDAGTPGVTDTHVKTIIGDTEIRYEPTTEYKGAYATPLPRWVPTWSPPWRAMVRFAAKEAGRLGLDLGVCIGPAGCGAPWVTHEFAQQELVWTEKRVTGPAALDEVLPVPKGGRTPLNADKTPVYYRDVAVQAVPARREWTRSVRKNAEVYPPVAGPKSE